MLEIEVGFDGSCPQSLEGVRQEGDAVFRIFPSWRREPGNSEECVGRTTRLGFRIRNRAARPVTGTLHLDWQFHDAPPERAEKWASCEVYMGLRDFCVVQEPGRDTWRYVMATIEGSVATMRLTLPPGTTEVHWHPPYNYAQSEAFVQSLSARPYTTVEHLGTTEGEHNLWLIRITDDSGPTKPPFLIRARVHAYESATSYALEGMVRFLRGDDPWAAVARRDHEFFILPMVNPDGVHDGMGRLTAPEGADLVWATPPLPNPGYTTTMAAVERIRPARFVDLHNWQTKFSDGLLGMEPERRERFFYYMPPVSPHGKRWAIREPEAAGGPPPSRETLGRYCRRVFGTQSASFEVSWFGRSPEDVRRFGEQALRAIILADTEPPAPERI